MDKEKTKGKNTEEATDDKSLLKPVLVPNKSVSVFKLGDDISNYFWLKYDYRQKNKDLEYDTVPIISGKFRLLSGQMKKQIKK